MPGKPAARVSDPTTHGNPLSPGPGSPNVLIGGRPAWRTIVDQHACPMTSASGPDGAGNVIVGSPTVRINNQMACRVQDVVVEKPGLAMGPMNPIAMGCPTVMIGEIGLGEAAAAVSPLAKLEAEDATAKGEASDEVIKQALADQKAMLEAKKAELEKWDAVAQARFKKWFGKTDEASKKTIQDRIDKMLELNKTLKPENFKRASPEQPGRFAYVYPNDPSTIYLDQAFDTAPATGKDSKAGTLAHEMSHFTTVGGTRDHIYGADNAKELAKRDSAKALENADNFEYYLEGVE